MTNGDKLLEYLSSISGSLSKQRAVCEEALQHSLPVARKACWSYSHFLHRTNKPIPDQQKFIKGFLKACRDCILHMVNGKPNNFCIELPAETDRTLLIGWHFPEYPLTLEVPLSQRSLVLVASQESWMDRLRKLHDTYCFRASIFSSILLRSFQSGRPIFAMLDHCYETSRHIITPFLSYPSRMPVGILLLASKFNYRMIFLSVRGRTIKPVWSIECAGQSPEYLAQELNSAIETEILRRPERWLLWPSVSSRWIGVDYGESN